MLYKDKDGNYKDDGVRNVNDIIDGMIAEFDHEHTAEEIAEDIANRERLRDI